MKRSGKQENFVTIRSIIVDFRLEGTHGTTSYQELRKLLIKVLEETLQHKYASFRGGLTRQTQGRMLAPLLWIQRDLVHKYESEARWNS